MQVQKIGVNESSIELHAGAQDHIMTAHVSHLQSQTSEMVNEKKSTISLSVLPQLFQFTSTVCVCFCTYFCAYLCVCVYAWGPLAAGPGDELGMIKVIKREWKEKR